MEYGPSYSHNSSMYKPWTGYSETSSFSSSPSRKSAVSIIITLPSRSKEREAKLRGGRYDFLSCDAICDTEIVTSLIESTDAISRNEILLFLKQYPKKDSILCNIRRAHLFILCSAFAVLDRPFKRF